MSDRPLSERVRTAVASESWARHGKLLKWADEIAALEAAGNRLREAVEQVVHDLDAGIYGGVTALGYLRAALEEGGE